MKIKLSHHTPRKSKGSTIISRKVSIHTSIRKITLEALAEIYLMSDAIHVMRKGHFARDCSRNKGGSHKNKDNKRRHHDHTAENDESPRKRVKEESEDSSSDEEYVLISSLTGTITHGSNDWLIDIGASKHMTGLKKYFVKLSEHD